MKIEGHYEALQAAKAWGFKVSEGVRKVRSLAEIYEFINYWDTARKALPVATDGIVLKVNSLRHAGRGVCNGHPLSAHSL